MHIRVHSPLTALFWLLRQEKESQSRAELTAKFVDLMIHKHKKNNHPPPPIRQTSFKNIFIWNETVILADGSLHHIKKMLYIFYNQKYLTQLAHNAKSQIDTFDQIYFHQVPIQTIYFRFSCLIHSH